MAPDLCFCELCYNASCVFQPYLRNFSLWIAFWQNFTSEWLTYWTRTNCVYVSSWTHCLFLVCLVFLGKMNELICYDFLFVWHLSISRHLDSSSNERPDISSLQRRIKVQLFAFNKLISYLFFTLEGLRAAALVMKTPHECLCDQ